MTRRTITLVGAGVGLAAFLALGLLPALLYGGYAGVMLAAGLAGAPVQATFLVRALVVMGMALGVLAVGALFTLAGAAAGAAISVLAGAPERAPGAKASKA
jgi:hypothetical protein